MEDTPSAPDENRQLYRDKSLPALQSVESSELRPGFKAIILNLKILHLPGFAEVFRHTMAVLFFGSLLFTTVMVVDTGIQKLLAWSQSGKPPSFLLISVTIVALVASWVAVKAPPPGGAGALLGDNPDGTWESSFSVHRIVGVLSILLVIVTISWFTF